MNDLARSKSRLQTLLPYVWAVVAGGLCYVSTMLWTSLSALAVALAFIVGIAVFVLSRLIQSRGRLSLKVTTIVLPLLVALVCFGLMQLNPFRQRHLTVSALRANDLVVWQKTPQIQGEWYRDTDSGIFLPSWLVRMCGENSMSPISSVSGPLDNLQRLNVSKLHLSKVHSIRLTRYEDDPALSVELIKGFCKLENLRVLQFEFDSIISADLAALRELNHLKHEEIRVEITVQPDKISPEVRLNEFPIDKVGFTFRGGSVGTKLIRQLTPFPYIQFSDCSLSGDALRAFSASEFQRIHFDNCVFAGDASAALASLSLYGVSLQSCTFTSPFQIGNQPTKLQALGVHNTPIAQSELVTWINAGKIRSFQVDRVLSDSELEEIKNCDSIELIHYYMSNGEMGRYDKEQ